MTYLFLELLVFEDLVRPLKDCPSPTLRFVADRASFLLLFPFLFFILGYVDFESGIVDPDFDVVRLGEKTFVQGAHSVVLALVLFKVDVGFPYQLWHIEGGLVDSKLIEGSRPLQIVQAAFKLRVLNPSLAIG